MATQTFSEATQQVQETLKETSGLLTKTLASMMDAYSKQMNTGYEFYKKLAKTAQHDGKATNWSDMIKESTSSYQKAINTSMNISKEIMDQTFSLFTENEWSSLSKKSADAILNIFTKQAEQSKEFGTQFLHELQNENILSPDAFKKQTARFNELMRESIKSSESAIKELVSAYNEQASYTQEATKKFMNSIQQQADSLIKTQERFSEELMPALSAKKSSAGKTCKHAK